MRTSHIYLIGVAILTLGFVAAAPGAADGQEPDMTLQSGQEAPADNTPAPVPEVPAGAELGAEERIEFSSWPVERQAEYQLWPVETQAYYWSLARERQALFWRLADEDKIALTAMTGPERETAWSRIESRASTPPPD